MIRRPLLLVLVLVVAALPAGAGPKLGRLTTVQVPENVRLKAATLADVNGDGSADLVLAVGALKRNFRRSLRVHLRKKGDVCFATRPDAVLDLTPDVVAFSTGDVGPAPGEEVVLFSATGAFAWRTAGGERERPRKLVGADLLWQLPDAKEVIVWRDGVRDLDGDGLGDLVIPEPAGYRIAFQRRKDGVSSFDGDVLLAVPGRNSPSEFHSRGARRIRFREEARRIRAGLTMDTGTRGMEETALSVIEALPYPVFTDWNGDGRLDLLAETTDELVIWDQRKGAGFAREPGKKLRLPLEVDRSRRLDVSFGTHAEDLNGDGRADCVIMAGDRRSEDARTQILVYHQDPKATETPLFGSSGRPRQVLLIGGFTGLTDLVDVDGNGLPDLVLGNLRLDALDAIRAASSGRLDANLNVYLNRGGKFSQRPDLTEEVELPTKGLREIRTRVVARFAGDITGNGVKDLLLRVDPELLQVKAVRLAGGKLVVLSEPVFSATIDKRADIEVHETKGGVPEVLVIERSQIHHVRFR